MSYSTPQIHTNIRMFHSNQITTPRTMADMNFWNVGYFQGMTMSGVQNPVTINTEQWQLVSATSGTTFSIGKDPVYRYTPSLSVSFSGLAPSGTLTSSWNDDILTSFNSPGATYYIEMLLRKFPSQGSPLYLNLSNSFIDFSSDPTGNYSPSSTDSIAFSSSLTNLTNGGDSILRFNRNQLTNSSLNSIKNIRFRLTTTGSGVMTFKAQNMRLYQVGSYDFNPVDINTKRGYLSGTITQSGSINIADTGIILFSSAPKNSDISIKFNSGHNAPLASGTNEIDIITRYTETVSGTQSYIKSSLTTSGSWSYIKIYDIASGTSNLLKTASGTLSNETDYIFTGRIFDNVANATISLFKGFSPQPAIIDTGPASILSLARRGYCGYRYSPYNFDFTIDYIGFNNAEYANYLSKPFKSFDPVVGIKLIPINSQPLNLTDSFTSYGDAYISSNQLGGNPSPDTLVTRSGTLYHGGYISSSSFDLGNTELVTVVGDIYPKSGFQGSIKLVLFNKYNSVSFIETISNLAINTWNHFEIPIRTKMHPDSYYILISDFGNYTDSFEVDNIKILYDTIGWQATSNGVNFLPFYDGVDDNYKAINFGTNLGRSVQIKATAYTEDAWVQNYSAIPIYGTYINPVPQIVNTSTVLKITGK